MQFPAELTNELRTRLAEARQRFPAALSKDQQALLVDGGIGYACFISPEGDVYYETYDWSSDEPAQVDRSPQAQLRVLVLGARLFPSLRELLPVRPAQAAACAQCAGTGWQERIFICFGCSGLGWLFELQAETQSETQMAVSNSSNRRGCQQTSESTISRSAFPKL
jgi:hypothetical protein